MSSSETEIVAEYRRRTPRSAELAAEAGQVLPSGITHDGRHLQPYGINVDRALGSRKWDVDGNEYVDYAGGHGALLLGHNHPAVVEAVAKQLERGTHFGSNHELEIRWGQAVQRLIPSAERVRFTSSGTEATLLALRLARAYTGRQKIVRFLGHFHGWHDHMAFGVYSRFDGSPSPGVVPGIASEVLLAPPSDVEATRKLLEEQGDQIAAVILEPTGASWGQVPLPPGLLPMLREITAKQGIVLIFDEVISGFRCAPGGAQAYYGITPDMTTLAKILAGGLPGGAVAGRAEILDGLSFVPAGTQREKISHHGTFNANPLSAAAGIAALKVVAETDACEKANQYAAQLREGMREVLREEDVPWLVYGTFSGFHIMVGLPRPDATHEDVEQGKFTPQEIKAMRNPHVINQLRLAAMCEGVDFFGWPGGPTSSAHTAEDLDRTITGFRSAIRRMKQCGVLDAQAASAAAR